MSSLLSSTNQTDRSLREVIEPVINALGFVLWGIELLTSNRQLLIRIYIDHEKGITIDDCSLVSEQVGNTIEVADLFSEFYYLEMSSPGLDRKFFEVEQLKGFEGEMLQIQLRQPINQQRRFKATLIGVEGDQVSLQLMDGKPPEQLEVPFSTIAKIRLVCKV